MITASNLVDVELNTEQRRALLARAREIVTLDWFGTTVAAHFNQEFEAEAFRRRYRAFLAEREPDLVTCAVASNSELPVFFAEPGNAWRYPSVLRRAGVIAFLADAVTQQSYFGINPKLSSFHAAAVRVGDVAAAISAISTGGKTTTSLACARRGMPLYTDERCVVIEGQVHAFPRAVNVRGGGLEILSTEDVPDDSGIGDRLRAHLGRDWESVQFSQLFGAAAPAPSPARLESIFFITGRARSPHVEALEPGAALHHIIASAFCGPRPGMDRLAAATALLQQARPYALTLGGPDDTALLIAGSTKRARPLFAAARQ